MTAAAYFYICDGDIDHPVLTHKKMDWPDKYSHWQEIPLVMAQPEQEPVAWEGGEGWESLAWELCADENGEDSCNELIWEGGPIPEPWGDRWMKYEEEAKRLIALVQKHTTPPQRTWVGLTDDEKRQLFEREDYQGWLDYINAIEAKLRSKNNG